MPLKPSCEERDCVVTSVPGVKDDSSAVATSGGALEGRKTSSSARLCPGRSVAEWHSTFPACCSLESSCRDLQLSPVAEENGAGPADAVSLPPSSALARRPAKRKAPVASQGDGSTLVFGRAGDPSTHTVSPRQRWIPLTALLCVTYWAEEERPEWREWSKDSPYRCSYANIPPFHGWLCSARERREPFPAICPQI